MTGRGSAPHPPDKPQGRSLHHIGMAAMMSSGIEARIGDDDGGDTRLDARMSEHEDNADESW